MILEQGGVSRLACLTYWDKLFGVIIFSS